MKFTLVFKVKALNVPNCSFQSVESWKFTKLQLQFFYQRVCKFKKKFESPILDIWGWNNEKLDKKNNPQR